jgi:hypothetical protein
MEHRQGGNLVPVCGGSDPPPFVITKKTKKNIPINIEPPYKYVMQHYILEKHINTKSSRDICMPSKLKHFCACFFERLLTLMKK